MVKYWTVIDSYIRGFFRFEDFQIARDFVNSCALEMDKQDHHARVTWDYLEVVFESTTHDAGGVVTERDWNLANRITEIYSMS